MSRFAVHHFVLVAVAVFATSPAMAQSIQIINRWANTGQFVYTDTGIYLEGTFTYAMSGDYPDNWSGSGTWTVTDLERDEEPGSPNHVATWKIESGEGSSPVGWSGGKVSGFPGCISFSGTLDYIDSATGQTGQYGLSGSVMF